MPGQTAFDYHGQAERVRQTQRALKDFSQAAYRTVHANPNRDTLRQWGQLQRTPTYQQLLDAFWTALDAAYPPGFDADFEKLPFHRDLQALETAVAFLEADPYFFRSGYIKEKLLRYIRGYHLPPEYVTRLHRVILHAVDQHYGREFGEYRKLAHRLDSDQLRLALKERTRREDTHIRNRAHWILDWLETVSKSANS
jgi:hypothetical protein